MSSHAISSVPALADCVLIKGSWFHVRPITAADKAALQDAFNRMSPQSRYRRFCYSKTSLSAEELRFFTEIDGVDHCAIGAFELSGYGAEGDLAGIVRYIRLAEECEVAEAAVVVMDDFQTRGLARLLLSRLAFTALRNRLRSFRFYFLADNARMRLLIAQPSWRVSFRNKGTLLAAECPLVDMLGLPDPNTGAPIDSDPLDELLNLIGNGIVTAPLALSLATAQVWWEAVQRGLDALGGQPAQPPLH